ncbi:FliM/FliN family flagellar motor switch protein [Sphingomonas sp. JC676]|uniref:FliM/FliN family flagellar motor switch protein n=1 Tax=Sphingomonas sp. JC676 TaxID=2768065 RepID=UPI00165803F7|nr:FliM/FliN family flagellar motor switch protein [Sphingomonas sp. JC676]MBC9032544.1 FliM/FliN family flagellar motor switch protein [Sphingomonas sp. JC676]
MSVLEGIMIDLSIVLGSAEVPIRQILQMSRGAMIPLDCGQDDPSLVYVNGELVAKGRILVDGERMSLEISELVKKSRH